MRVPSKGQAHLCEDRFMRTAGAMPLASRHPSRELRQAWSPPPPAFSVSCGGSQPCTQGPGPERKGWGLGTTQEHGDLRPPGLALRGAPAPQVSGRGSLGAFPATGDLGGGHPLVLSALPWLGSSQLAVASTLPETCVWGAVLGGQGHCLRLGFVPGSRGWG